MSDEYEKLASDVPGILGAAAQHLRVMAEQNVELQKRASAAEHELRLIKLAQRMESRGIEPNLSLEEKVATLLELNDDKLAATEAAVELSAGGFNLGRLRHSSLDGGTKVASQQGELYTTESGADDLDSFIESQQALG
jgi:hypothetical protein